MLQSPCQGKPSVEIQFELPFPEGQGGTLGTVVAVREYVRGVRPVRRELGLSPLLQIAMVPSFCSRR